MHWVASITSPLLLRAELVIAEEIQCLCGGGLVVAGVIRESGNGGERELLVGDPVLLAQLHRLHAELSRHLVDDALDGVGGLGPAGTTVGVGGCLVGEDTCALERVCVHLVDPGEHEHAQQWRTGRDDLQVGTHVGQQRHFEAQELSVLGGGKLDVLDLVATMVSGDHVLAAGFGPLDGSTQLARELRDKDLLAGACQFAAEATPDVGCDDAKVVLRNSRHQCQEHAKDVRHLGGGPQGDLIAHAHGCGHDRARLHERGDESLVDEAALDDDIRLRGSLVVAATEVVDVAGVVGSYVVHGCGGIVDRLLHVDDGRKWRVVDVD